MRADDIRVSHSGGLQRLRFVRKRSFDQAARGSVRQAGQPLPRGDRRAQLAAAVTVVLWASAFVAIRSAGHDFSPGALALGRLLPAAAVLALISLRQRVGWPPRAAWPGIVATGVLWFGVYMVALNWGEQHVDAGTAAMVVNIGPILIALLSGWLLRRGPAAPADPGDHGVVRRRHPGRDRHLDRQSPLAGREFCCACWRRSSYSVAVVSQKPALRHASALQVTTFGCAVGALACLPFSGQLVSQLATAPLTATLSVAYLGVFPTAVAFTTWAYALSKTSASKMGATTYLVPALTVLMSWAILGQVPSWLALAGGMLCLAGVALSRGRPATPADEPAMTSVLRLAAGRPGRPAPGSLRSARGR